MGKSVHADQKEVRDLNLVSAGTRAGKGTEWNLIRLGKCKIFIKQAKF